MANSTGVNRAYTLVDVLATIAGVNQGVQQVTTTVNGLGLFGEADETVPVADSVTAQVLVAPGWDGGQWSTTTWS